MRRTPCASSASNICLFRGASSHFLHATAAAHRLGGVQQAASHGGDQADQNAANWQHASAFYRQCAGALDATAAASRMPAVLSTLAAVPLPGICGASWIPYEQSAPDHPGRPSAAAGREPMSDGAPAGDSDAFVFPCFTAEDNQPFRAACRREADSYCTAWNQSVRPQVNPECVPVLNALNEHQAAVQRLLTTSSMDMPGRCAVR